MSCAYVPIARNTPNNEPWTNYVIGRVQSAPTGATMVEWIGRARFLRGYLMVSPVKVIGTSRQPPTDSGAWPARYTYHGPCTGGRYVITNPKFYGEEIGIIVADDGTIPCDRSVLQVQGVKRGRQWRTPESVGTRAFTPVPVVADLTEAPIKWELIYSGRSGEEIALAYREYASGPDGTFARSAFYQDLKYDLSKSSRIVFRSMELEIVEASNAGVTFRVLRDAERSSSDQPPSNLAPRR